MKYHFLERRFFLELRFECLGGELIFDGISEEHWSAVLMQDYAFLVPHIPIAKRQTCR